MDGSLHWLDEKSLDFPDPAGALRYPNGLLAAGGDLSAPRLLRAYQAGIFPWFEAGQPPLWWSPDPRMVLFPDELHVSRSMAKLLRKTGCVVKSDTDFASVMAGCAAPRADSQGTWITPDMQQAYAGLHALGHAHSVEVWEDGQLQGGLYGIAMGRVFFGESMFSRKPNMSKIAFVDLVRTLGQAGYTLIDCQVANPHLESLGARNIPRQEFMAWLPDATEIGTVAPWPYNKGAH